MATGMFEDSRNFDIRATAIDKTPYSNYVVAAGYHNAYIFDTKSLETFQDVRIRTKYVNKLSCHPRNISQVAILSGPDIFIYALDTFSQRVRLKMTNGSCKNISDISWNHFNPSLIATCSPNDVTCVRDLRVARKVAIEIGPSSGAYCVQYSPMMDNILATCNFGRVSIWDQRHQRVPLSEFDAHNGQITCLKWHPNNHHSFLTSSRDGLLRCWDLFDDNGKLVEQSDVQERDLSCSKFWFSPDGEEYAVITSPRESQDAGQFSVYQYPFLENLNPLKIDSSDVFLDLCWDKHPEKPSKFVWAVRQNKGLIRHAIVFDYSSENREEMDFPIAQSAMDEESDLLAAIENKESLEKAISYSSSSEFGSPDKGGNIIGHMDMDKPEKQYPSPSTSWDHREASPIRMSPSTSVTPMKHLAQMLLNRQLSSSTGLADYEKWITAPNVTGGDLLTELDALYNVVAEGVTMNEINYFRAAIGFVYEHSPMYRKLSFECRYHRDFFENGKIVVIILQKNCPLTADQANGLLKLMQVESDRQQKIFNKHEPVFARVLKQLKSLVISLKIFVPESLSTRATVTPTMTIPKALQHHYHYPFHFDDRRRPTSTSSIIDETESEGSESSLRQSISLSFAIGAFDEWVPAPRTSGGQFDCSGYLVRFGNFRSTIRQTLRPEGNNSARGSIVGGINFKALGITDVDGNDQEEESSSSDDSETKTLISLLKRKPKRVKVSSESTSSDSTFPKNDMDYEDVEKSTLGITDEEDEGGGQRKGSSEAIQAALSVFSVEDADAEDSDKSEEDEVREQIYNGITFQCYNIPQDNIRPYSPEIPLMVEKDLQKLIRNELSPSPPGESIVCPPRCECSSSLEPTPPHSPGGSSEDIPCGVIKCNPPKNHPYNLSRKRSPPPKPSYIFEAVPIVVPDHIPEPSLAESDDSQYFLTSEEPWRDYSPIPGDCFVPCFRSYKILKELRKRKEKDRLSSASSTDSSDASVNFSTSSESDYSSSSRNPLKRLDSSSPSSFSSGDAWKELRVLKKRKKKKRSVLSGAPKSSMFPFGDVKAAPRSLVDYLDLMGPILKEIAQQKRDAVNSVNTLDDAYSPDGYPRGDAIPYHCVSPIRTFSLSSSPTATAASMILHRNNPRGKLSTSPVGSFRHQSHRHRGGSLTLTDPDSNIKSSSSDFLVSTPVELFDVSRYLPISKEFASGYRLISDSHKKLLKHNCRQVENSRRENVKRTWNLIKDYLKKMRSYELSSPEKHCCEPICPSNYWDWSQKNEHEMMKEHRCDLMVERTQRGEGLPPWELTEMNTTFLLEVLNRHLKLGDYQTAAVISCTLSDICRLPPKRRPKSIRWDADPDQPDTTTLVRSSSELNNLAGSPLNNTKLSPNTEKTKRSASIGGSTGPLAERNTIQGGLVSSPSATEPGPSTPLADEDNFQKLKRLALRKRARSDNVNATHCDANIFPTEPLFDEVEPSAIPLAVAESAPVPSKEEEGGEAFNVEDGAILCESKSDEEYVKPTIGTRQMQKPPMPKDVFDQFETARVAYGEILARWGMYQKSAEVFKFCTTQQPDSMALMKGCTNCGDWGETEEAQNICANCKADLFHCIICDASCHGLMLTCPRCTHGGHPEHMNQWFKEQSMCAFPQCLCLCPF